VPSLFVPAGAENKNTPTQRQYTTNPPHISRAGFTLADRAKSPAQGGGNKKIVNKEK